MGALPLLVTQDNVWKAVSAGYADGHPADEEPPADEYPEYQHLRVSPIPAEGPHNES
jgi:hypothetical protein